MLKKICLIAIAALISAVAFASSAHASQYTFHDQNTGQEKSVADARKIVVYPGNFFEVTLKNGTTVVDIADAGGSRLAYLKTTPLFGSMVYVGYNTYINADAVATTDYGSKTACTGSITLAWAVGQAETFSDPQLTACSALKANAR